MAKILELGRKDLFYIKISKVVYGNIQVFNNLNEEKIQYGKEVHHLKQQESLEMNDYTTKYKVHRA